MRKLAFLVVLAITCSLIWGQVLLDPRYHTYAEMKAEMDSLAALYPDLCMVDSVGVTDHDNLPIWGLKLSDNVATDEDEPALLFVGQCHAEEVLGNEIVMYMINDILEHRMMPPYAYWLQYLEVWFVPTINPEGLQVVMDGWDTAFRKNKTDCNENGTFLENIDYVPGPGNDEDGVDINRNYGFNWIHGDTLWCTGGEETYDYYKGPAPFSEGGTRAIRDLAAKQHFLYSINWHSSRTGNLSEQLFYPFSWTDTKQAVDFEYNTIIGETVAGLIERETPTGSQQFYEPSPSMNHKGSAHEWFYQAHGTVQLLIECGTSNLQPNAAIVDDTCQRNSLGAYWLLNKALGAQIESPMITGHITDATTGQPLVAEIIVEEKHASYFAPRLSDELYGRYWRLIMPGTYTVRIRKMGYEEQVFTNVVVNNSGQTTIDAALQPRPAATLSGTVTTPDGTPATITLFDLEDISVITSADGTYSLDAYEGEYPAQITADGTVPLLTTITLSAGANTQDITLQTAEIVFEEDWNDGFMGWGTDGPWLIQTNPATGQHYVNDNDERFYDNYLDAYLWTAGINTNGASDDMMLCLEHQYYTEFDEDFCRVEISTDGQNWTELASFDGKADYWQTTYIPLGDYTDELIRLRFHLDTDPSLNDPGWLIGDVRIVASTGAHTPQIPVVETKLTGNYPNPFNPTTQINFSLAEAGDVELSIYNVRGQKVRTLVKEELPAMDHSILWNGTDDNDQSVSSGVYFYKLKTGDYRSTKKMLLIK
jgi:hypothetical protein